jgi:hypothetical protein
LDEWREKGTVGALYSWYGKTLEKKVQWTESRRGIQREEQDWGQVDFD